MKKNLELLKVYAQYYHDYAKDNNVKGMHLSIVRKLKIVVDLYYAPC